MPRPVTFHIATKLRLAFQVEVRPAPRGPRRGGSLTLSAPTDSQAAVSANTSVSPTACSTTARSEVTSDAEQRAAPIVSPGRESGPISQAESRSSRSGNHKPCRSTGSRTKSARSGAEPGTTSGADLEMMMLVDASRSRGAARLTGHPRIAIRDRYRMGQADATRSTATRGSRRDAARGRTRSPSGW